LFVGAQEEAGKTAAQANSATSPVRRGKTVDDATGKVKSEVVIWNKKGKLYGQIGLERSSIMDRQSKKEKWL
jgi:hypothetical protein